MSSRGPTRIINYCVGFLMLMYTEHTETCSEEKPRFHNSRVMATTSPRTKNVWLQKMYLFHGKILLQVLNIPMRWQEHKFFQADLRQDALYEMLKESSTSKVLFQLRYHSLSSDQDNIFSLYNHCRMQRVLFLLTVNCLWHFIGTSAINAKEPTLSWIVRCILSSSAFSSVDSLPGHRFCSYVRYRCICP